VKTGKNGVKAKNQLIDFIRLSKSIFAKNGSKPKLAKVLNNNKILRCPDAMNSYEPNCGTTLKPLVYVN
jgi:hypothetical protein